MPSSGNKNSGEIAESLFYSEVLVHGLVPLISCGENLPFDIVVYSRETHKFFKAQVKSTRSKAGRAKWTVGCGSRVKRSYSTADVDIIALHDFTENAWYLIPAAELNGARSVTISARQTKFAGYRDGWSLLLQ